jgi:hypothetical protein
MAVRQLVAIGIPAAKLVLTLALILAFSPEESALDVF